MARSSPFLVFSALALQVLVTVNFGVTFLTKPMPSCALRNGLPMGHVAFGGGQQLGLNFGVTFWWVVKIIAVIQVVLMMSRRLSFLEHMLRNRPPLVSATSTQTDEEDCPSTQDAPQPMRFNFPACTEDACACVQRCGSTVAGNFL